MPNIAFCQLLRKGLRVSCKTLPKLENDMCALGGAVERH